MIEYIVLGICVLIFLGAIAFVVVAGLVKWLRKPAPVRQAPPQSPPAQPAPIYVQVPTQQTERVKFFDLFVADKKEREAELERIALRGTLDKIAGILGPGPTPPPTPPNP